MFHLPKLIHLPSSMMPADQAIHFSPILAKLSPLTTNEVLSRMKTTLDGLSESRPYLQSQVKDIGLPAPFKHMIPLVEFAFTTPVNRGGSPATGTIQRFVLGVHMQVLVVHLLALRVFLLRSN